MIPFLRDNSVVFLGLLSWFIAQLIKFIIEVSTHRRINWRRFFESGGMPSSHSAFVCSIAMGIGFREGFASSFFALAFMIAMVVMYDAMGVRRAAGEQAEAINELREKSLRTRWRRILFQNGASPCGRPWAISLPRSSAARSWESRYRF